MDVGTVTVKVVPDMDGFRQAIRDAIREEFAAGAAEIRAAAADSAVEHAKVVAQAIQAGR